MDGTFAALFLLAGLTDMGLNHCGSGCLNHQAAQPRLAFSVGEVQFNGDGIGTEAYLRYSLGRQYGPFQPAVGLSLSDDGDAWVGLGATWTAQFAGGRGYAELHLMPGLYAQGSGPDLGHTIEFRSGVEIGIEDRRGWRWGLSYDHRSNAEIGTVNPGLETLQLRVSVPLK